MSWQPGSPPRAVTGDWLMFNASRRPEQGGHRLPLQPGIDELTTGRVVSTPISRGELQEWAGEQFGDWVKAVVDVSRGIMAVGGDLHADDEGVLLADGSLQRDLWGINLHPAVDGADWIEFDSMINIRPREGNRSRGVDDQRTRARVRSVVESLIVAE